MQRDIPRILEALLAFLAEVEAAQAALRPKPAEMPEAEKKVLEFLGEVEKAVEGEEGQKKAEERARQKEREREEAMHLEEARTVLGEVGDGESLRFSSFYAFGHCGRLESVLHPARSSFPFLPSPFTFR